MDQALLRRVNMYDFTITLKMTSLAIEMNGRQSFQCVWREIFSTKCVTGEHPGGQATRTIGSKQGLSEYALRRLLCLQLSRDFITD